MYRKRFGSGCIVLPRALRPSFFGQHPGFGLLCGGLSFSALLRHLRRGCEGFGGFGCVVDAICWLWQGLIAIRWLWLGCGCFLDFGDVSALFVGLGMVVEHFRLRLGREAIRLFGWAVGAIRRLGLYRRSYPLALELFVVLDMAVKHLRLWLGLEDILSALLELIRHTWSKRPLWRPSAGSWRGFLAQGPPSPWYGLKTPLRASVGP